VLTSRLRRENLSDDLEAPIHAICPGCGEPSQDLLAHAPHCSTPEALDLRVAVDEETLRIRAAIQEIEFALRTVPSEQAALYASRLAELHNELHRMEAPSTAYRRLLDVLRERRLLLDS
jgi:hypothetical protein